MTDRPLRQFYYDNDYYQLKLEEVIKTEEEIFEETIYKLSRKDLPADIIQSGLSNFGKTIHGSGFAFLNLNLSGRDVYSLRVVSDHAGHREVPAPAEHRHQQQQDHRPGATERPERADPHRCDEQPDQQPQALQVASS